MEIDQHPVPVARRHAGLGRVDVGVHPGDPGVPFQGRKQDLLPGQIARHEGRHAVLLAQHGRVLHVFQMLGQIRFALWAQEARNGNRHGGRVHRPVGVDADGGRGRTLRLQRRGGQANGAEPHSQGQQQLSEP